MKNKTAYNSGSLLAYLIQHNFFSFKKYYQKVLLFSYALLINFSMSLSAVSETFESVLIQTVTSIYDGDTFRVDIANWPDVIGKHIPIRVNGIDTPELRGKCEKEKRQAKAAKQFTVTLLNQAKVIELKNLQRGKYFRIVADVYIDGTNLGLALINNGLAVSYNGGTKTKNWCE